MHLCFYRVAISAMVKVLINKAIGTAIYRYGIARITFALLPIGLLSLYMYCAKINLNAERCFTWYRLSNSCLYGDK